MPKLSLAEVNERLSWMKANEIEPRIIETQAQADEFNAYNAMFGLVHRFRVGDKFYYPDELMNGTD